MLLTEYDEAKTMELFRQEGLEEGLERGMERGMKRGLEEGRSEGRMSTLLSLVQSGELSVEKAAGFAGVSEAAFRERLRAD